MKSNSLNLDKHVSYSEDIPAVGLTKREKEVLIYLAKGYTKKETAISLCIAQNTVKEHVKSIYKKLGIHCVAEATVAAFQLGIIRH